MEDTVEDSLDVRNLLEAMPSFNVTDPSAWDPRIVSSNAAENIIDSDSDTADTSPSETESDSGHDGEAESDRVYNGSNW